MDFKPEDFPNTSINWPKFVELFGPEPALWLKDQYGGDERVYIHVGESVRSAYRRRISSGTQTGTQTGTLPA